MGFTRPLWILLGCYGLAIIGRMIGTSLKLTESTFSLIRQSLSLDFIWYDYLV